MALDTVADYVTEARRLLQDTRAPYRYPDADYVAALNQGLLESARVRPDFFILTPVAQVALGQPVAYPPAFRVALSYYVMGKVGLVDAEAAQDSRSSGFLGKFVQQLTTLAS